MKKLDHKNVIKLYNVYETQNSIYLILEFLNGGEMITKCKEQRSKFNIEDIKYILEQVICAILYLHQHDVMHRDLKPENILFLNKETQQLKIADFGLAQFISNQQVLFTRCGTPGFVAPEVLCYKTGSKLYDEKCDIFSIGVIFYVLMVGKQPFHAKDFQQILRNNKNCIVNFEELEEKHFPIEAINLLKKMMEKDPQKRITAEEALNDEFFKEKSPKNKQLLQIPLQHSYSQLPHINLHSFNQNLQNKNMTQEIGSIDYLLSGEHKLQHNYQGIHERFESHQVINHSQGSIFIQNSEQFNQQISPKKIGCTNTSNFNPHFQTQHQNQHLKQQDKETVKVQELEGEYEKNQKFNFQTEEINFFQMNNSNQYSIKQNGIKIALCDQIRLQSTVNKALSNDSDESDEQNQLNNDQNSHPKHQQFNNQQKRKTSSDFRKKAILNSQRLSNQILLDSERDKDMYSQLSQKSENQSQKNHESIKDENFLNSEEELGNQSELDEALSNEETVVQEKNRLQLIVQNIFSNEIKKV